jgi:hypothetical protein
MAAQLQQLTPAEALRGAQAVLDRYLGNVVAIEGHVKLAGDAGAEVLDFARAEARAFVEATFGANVDEGLAKIDRAIPPMVNPDEAWGSNLSDFSVRASGVSINSGTYAQMQVDNMQLIRQGQQLLNTVESADGVGRTELMAAFQTYQSQSIQTRSANDALLREPRLAAQAYAAAVDMQTGIGITQEVTADYVTYRGTNGLVVNVNNMNEHGAAVTAYIPDDVHGVRVNNAALGIDMPARVVEVQLQGPNAFGRIGNQWHLVDTQIRSQLHDNLNQIRSIESNRITESSEQISALLQQIRAGLGRQVFRRTGNEP